MKHAAILVFSLFAATPVVAGALQVSPILLEAPAGAAALSMTLRNEGGTPLSAQARVYIWEQVNGRETLTPATDVAASPPTVTVQPRQDYVIRIVRLKKGVAQKEENYRIIVSELPDPARQKAGTVELLVNHSVPVFFKPADGTPAQLTWSAAAEGQQLALRVANGGTFRARLSQVKLSNGKSTFSLADGLLGYALGGSVMEWRKPVPAGFASGPLRLTAMTDNGPIDVRVQADR